MRARAFTLAAVVIVATAGTSQGQDAACIEKMKIDERIGILIGIRAAPKGLDVIVDEQVWAGLQFKSKQSIVDTINCAMLPTGEQFNPIVFRSHLTNKIVGKQERGELTIP